MADHSGFHTVAPATAVGGRRDAGSTVRAAEGSPMPPTSNVAASVCITGSRFRRTGSEVPMTPRQRLIGDCAGH